MPARMRLSLSMIVKNEEKFIAGCLDSVKDIVDEMIIVDTGSTDRTVEIAKSYHATIIPFAWIDDFSAARNESLRHCTGDWVLYLDADERIAPESRQLLRRAIAQQNVNVLRCIVRSEEYLPSGLLKSMTPQHRLFRRSPTVFFEGKIHERIEASVSRSGWTPAPSGIYIDHLGYAQSVEVNMKKFERNLSLLQAQMASDPHDAYSQFQLGNTLTLLGRTDEAYREMQKALVMPAINQGLLRSVLNMLSVLCYTLNDLQRGIEYAQQSLEIFPAQIGVHWNLAALFVARQEYASAIPALQQVLSLQSDPHHAEKMTAGFDSTRGLDEVWYLLGVCFEGIENTQEAVHSYVRALKVNPRYANVVERFLFNVHRYGDQNFIRRELEWLHAQLPESVPVKNTLAQVYLNMKRYQDAEKLLFDDPAREADEALLTLRLEYHVVVNELERAAEIYKQSQRIGSDSYAFHKIALQFSLAAGNTPQALDHLGKMSRGVENVALQRQAAPLRDSPVQPQTGPDAMTTRAGAL